MMTVRCTNAFFHKDMGLVSGQLMVERLRRPLLTVDEFLAMNRKKKQKWRNDAKTATFFKNAYAR